MKMRRHAAASASCGAVRLGVRGNCRLGPVGLCGYQPFLGRVHHLLESLIQFGILFTMFFQGIPYQFLPFSMQPFKS